uniref:UBZ4-type domain-containing protein n=1 Tax=Cacopsylla melanoneura TaxID=428564 RepID=A0A8D8RY31_9HEMI
MIENSCLKMETQENSQPTSPVHDEITVETSDSDTEVEQQVKYENEKNSNMMKAYENSPKLNISSNNINRNNVSMVKVHQPTLSRPKPTEWQILTHVKLTHDVDVPKLPVHFKETNDNRNVFFCLSTSEQERKQSLSKMFEVYNAWRKQYNELRGFNSVDVAFDRTDNHVGKPREREQSVDGEDNEEDKPREKTPDITNDDDFPTLGGGRSSTSRTNVSLNKSSSSKQVESVIDVDIDEFEEKDDPDDQDFIPGTQKRNKKNNKKTVYKKPSDNIFDFRDDATAWQSSKEVATASKAADPKKNRSQVIQEPIVVVEEKIPCPICNKQFPLSQIETHASDCLSFEDEVPMSSRVRRRNQSPSPVPNIEADDDDAILVSDDEDNDSGTKTNARVTVKTEHPFIPKTKRLLSDPDTSLSSPTKKFCQS